jgi:hypothetical protein
MTSDSQVVCAGLWQWVQSPGLERFEFSRAGDEWLFRGTILTMSHNASVEVKYEIACDRSFKTKHANISLLDSNGERSLKIETQTAAGLKMAGKTRQSRERSILISVGARLPILCRSSG